MSSARESKELPTNCIIAAFHNSFDVAVMKRKFNVIPISASDLAAITRGEKPLFTAEQFILQKTNVIQLQYPELKESGEEAANNLLAILALSKNTLEAMKILDKTTFYSAFDFNLGFSGVDNLVITPAFTNKIEAMGFRLVRTLRDTTEGKPALRLLLVGAGKEGILADNAKKSFNFRSDAAGLKPMMGTAALIPALVIKTPPPSPSLQKLPGSRSSPLRSSPLRASGRMSPAVIHQALGATGSPATSSPATRGLVVHLERLDANLRDRQTPPAPLAPDSTQQPNTNPQGPSLKPRRLSFS